MATAPRTLPVATVAAPASVTTMPIVRCAEPSRGFGGSGVTTSTSGGTATVSVRTVRSVHRRLPRVLPRRAGAYDVISKADDVLAAARVVTVDRHAHVARGLDDDLRQALRERRRARSRQRFAIVAFVARERLGLVKARVGVRVVVLLLVALGQIQQRAHRRLELQRVEEERDRLGALSFGGEGATVREELDRGRARGVGVGMGGDEERGHGDRATHQNRSSGLCAEGMCVAEGRGRAGRVVGFAEGCGATIVTVSIGIAVGALVASVGERRRRDARDGLAALVLAGEDGERDDRAAHAAITAAATMIAVAEVRVFGGASIEETRCVGVSSDAAIAGSAPSGALVSVRATRAARSGPSSQNGASRAASSPTSRGLFAGSFSRHDSMTRTSSSGTSCRREARGTALDESTAAQISGVVLPGKGISRVSSS